MPELDKVYAACDFAAKQADSCNIWDIAPKIGVTLPPQKGQSQAEIDALPAFNTWRLAG
jgi:hypothetical protein